MAKEKVKEKKRQTRGSDWDDVPPIQEGKRFDAEIESFSFSENSHSQIRLVGPVFAVKTHWVPTIKKDGSRGSFPKLCLHNDKDAEMCPYCKAGIPTNTRYMTNAIIRDLEESRPRKAKWDSNAEFKSKNDDNWTPIRVVSFPASVMQKILNFKSLTKIKTKNGIKTFHVSHPTYGRDLNVKLDTSGSGSGMYDVQREAVSKLEGEELEYLKYDIDTVYDAIESEEDALATLRSLFERGVFEGVKTKDGKSVINLSELQKLLGIKSRRHSDEDDYDDEDDVPRRKKSKGEKKRRKHDDEDDDEVYDTEDDDDIDDEDNDEEEDESLRRKSSKKSSKKSKKSYDEDDDDELEDLEDEDDEEEEEKPRKRSKSKKSSRREIDEDEDEDLDEEDEDLEEDEEEEEKHHKKSKRSSKKSSKDDDEEDEDDDEEEDKPRKKSKSKKSRKEEDDEDEDDVDDLDLDDDEEDEDDEEEEEKPRKKSSKKRR